MFAGAAHFNQPLDTWDVSNVTNFANMFGGAAYFNQPLNMWDVSNATDMNYMFASAITFNQPLSSWDVSNVTDMHAMFTGATSFNQPISNWDVSSVTNMNGMFASNAIFNQNIENWDVSNVTDMGYMFWNNSAFNQPLENWDVSNVTNMANMFEHNTQFNQPLENWDVSNVTNMANMFGSNTQFNQPLNNWNVSNVINMSNMFIGSHYNKPIDAWVLNANVNLTYFLSYSHLDKTNYDNFLTHLSTSNVNPGNLGAHNLNYCNVGVRNYLVNTLGWNIQGDIISNDCYMITGNLLYDENNDGCDVNDFPTNGFMIRATDGTNNWSTFSNNGTYTLTFTPTIVSASVVNLPDYLTATPASATVDYSSSDDVLPQDFCITANQSVEDLNIVVLPLGQPQPGFDTEYKIIATNIGTQIVTNATVTFTYNNSMQSYVSATATPSTTSTNSITFNLGSLPTLSTETITVTLNTFTPPTVNAGDLINISATIAPTTNDITPEDNLSSFEDVVVGSFDPNDKTVLQGDQIAIEQADEYLDYIIRFQNTGSANATKVKVKDILSPILDYNTLIPVSASHNYRVEITNGNQVEFIFDNINLPYESADEPGSHGYIAYKIKPKSTVQIGDVITGNAAIYFDYNLPIVTNMVSTTIMAPMAVDGFNADAFKIYPNPANNVLNISLPQGVQLQNTSIYNLQGQLVVNSNNNTSLNIAQLNSGLYLVKISTDQGTVTRQLVKE